jgi:hypothetical protein
VFTSLGNAVADAILFREDPDLVVLSEAKSGRNIDEDQARTYAATDAHSLRRAGTMPPLFGRGRDPAVACMFVGLEEERADLETALTHLGINAPLLTIGRDRVRLSDTSAVHGLDDFDRVHESGLPPARVRVDHQSPPSEIQELLVQEIVAGQARGEEHLDTEALCQAMLPEWPILSHSGRRLFIRRVEEVARSLAQGAMRRDIRFEPTSGQTRSRIAVIHSPVQFDPRGATQSWQAVERRAARALGRTPRPQIPGQMSLEDLAGEGGLAAE